MTREKHTLGPLQVRMESTCTGAWAEIGQECLDPRTQETWWRELGRSETTHVERSGPRGSRLPGPVGTITERPKRFKLTKDGKEHIANAHLWAASPVLLTAARDYLAAFDAEDVVGEGLARERLRAAIATATGGTS